MISFGQQSVRNNSGIISDNNPTLNKYLDSIFSAINKSTPGVAVSVIQKGKILAKRSYGLASLEHKILYPAGKKHCPFYNGE